MYCFFTTFLHVSGQEEAQHNRDYVVSKISDEIHELIRVLQLTTYDEDEWDEDDITVMKKAQVGTFTLAAEYIFGHWIFPCFQLKFHHMSVWRYF